MEEMSWLQSTISDENKKPQRFPLGLFALLDLLRFGGRMEFVGVPMNTLERRRLVRAQVVDAAVAKAAINKSRRERLQAAEVLRKQMAASRAASRRPETVSYPQAG